MAADAHADRPADKPADGHGSRGSRRTGPEGRGVAPQEENGLHPRETLRRSQEALKRSQDALRAAQEALLRSEEARRESEVRLARKATLIDLAWDAILAHEPITGRITFWGRGAERLYGFPREEALGQAVHELLATAFPLPRSELLAALERDGRWEGDLVHTTRDGRRLTVESRWALQQDEGDEAASVSATSGSARAVLQVNRDVTDRRRREAEEREEAERQREIATALQRSLLVVPPPDAFPGLSVKPFYEPADAEALVGGDFFDVVAVAEDRVALVVGDATGKGLGAAAHTAEVKFALRAFLREHAGPASALEHLNNFLVDRDRLDPAHLGTSYVALVDDPFRPEPGQQRAGVQIQGCLEMTHLLFARRG
jgi:PAS domain S-box-containing protein